MPKFCISCGSPMDESLKFCTKCGAQLGSPPAPAPTPVPAQTAVPPTAVGGAVPAAPPAAAGSPILKVIPIVVGVFAVVTVLGIGSCFYIGYRARKNLQERTNIDGSKSVRIQTDRGRVTIGEITGGEAAKTATVDIPPYPGATPTERGSAISVGGQRGISSQEYLTPDPVEKVVAFYKDKLSSKVSIVQAEGNAEFTFITENGISTVTIKHDEDAGKTQIVVAHMGKK